MRDTAHLSKGNLGIISDMESDDSQEGEPEEINEQKYLELQWSRGNVPVPDEVTQDHLKINNLSRNSDFCEPEPKDEENKKRADVPEVPLSTDRKLLNIPIEIPTTSQSVGKMEKRNKIWKILGFKSQKKVPKSES